MFAGRFELKCPLGSSHTGGLWLAEEQRPKRLVALKFLPDVICRDQEALDDLGRLVAKASQLTTRGVPDDGRAEGGAGD